ncbi:MAG: response regulator [Bdellovibrionales bacterium]|nr:response regulator [Bdellovibrionales bacterium]
MSGVGGAGGGQAGQKSVLIVDDDETLREAFVFDFKRRGYRVLSASSGTEAFKIAQAERLDAVITDVRMPNGTGVELLDNIKTMNARLPVVIFVTGFSDLSTEDAYDKGAFAVMSKPFDRKVLAETVQKAMLGCSERLSTSAELAPDAPQVVLPADLSGALRAVTLRFGQGGMSLAYEGDSARVGQPVSFRIEHPGHGLPPLFGQGVIRWMRESDPTNRVLGIEFTYLDPACRPAAVAFLDGLHVKAFIPKSAA